MSDKFLSDKFWVITWLDENGDEQILLSETQEQAYTAFERFLTVCRGAKLYCYSLTKADLKRLYEEHGALIIDYLLKFLGAGHE